jgi:hypothetical protein
VSGTCLNCGTSLVGAFCHQCGQAADTRAHPTLREVAIDTWDEVVQVDGRVARTLRTLLTRPGQLTIESARGRRAAFVPPVKLYLWCSVVYFAIAAFSPDTGKTPNVRLTGVDSIRVARDFDRAAARQGLDSAEADSLRKRGTAWLIPLVEGAQRMEQNPAGYQRAFLSNVPKLMFLLVPFYAAIVALFFRGTRYPEHLHFALHLHAVMFLLLAVCELPSWIPSGSGRAVADFITKSVLLLGMPVYSVVAMRRVYARAWGGTIGRAIGIGTVYGLIAGTSLLLVVFLTAVMFR